MAYYAIGGTQGTLTTTYKGLVSAVGGATAQRSKWYEIILGSTANPNATDTYFQVDVSRLSNTTSIAGTAFTPNPLDPADAAATTVCIVNVTTEPSAALVVSSLMNFGANQRATTRWVASQESQYLTAPATAAAGLYMRALSSTMIAALAGQISIQE